MDMTKLKDAIPYMDGGFRRRMFGGMAISFAVAILMSSQSDQFDATLADMTSISTAVGGTTIAVAVVLLVFGVGVIVEMISELFVRRSIGNIVYSARYPIMKIDAKTAPARWLLRLSAYVVVMPTVMVFSLIWGLVSGRCYYRTDVDGFVGHGSKQAFATLHAVEQDGLKDPFGSFFESGWKNAACRLSERNRRIVFVKFAWCSDIVSVVTVFLIIAAMALITFAVWPMASSGSDDQALKTLFQESVAAETNQNRLEQRHDDLQGSIRAKEKERKRLKDREKKLPSGNGPNTRALSQLNLEISKLEEQAGRLVVEIDEIRINRLGIDEKISEIQNRKVAAALQIAAIIYAVIGVLIVTSFYYFQSLRVAIENALVLIQMEQDQPPQEHGVGVEGDAA